MSSRESACSGSSPYPFVGGTPPATTGGFVTGHGEGPFVQPDVRRHGARRQRGLVAVALLASVLLAVAPSTEALAAQVAHGISWPAGQALPTFAEPRHLDVADIEGLAGDEQVLFTTLQGLVNRSKPRVFLLQGGDEGKLTGLVSDTTVPQTFVRPWDLVSGYRNEIRGVVVFDPAVPATIN